LEITLGIKKTTKPELEKVYRHNQAIPQYHIGHLELRSRIEAAEERHKGFFASGNALKGIGVIDCVRESESTAEKVARLVKNQI
jgi:oxygen-dependent protoporphyrinogen oxidase